MSSPFFNQRYVDGHVVSASIHPREGHDRIDYEDVEVLSERDANGRPRYWMQMVMEGGKVGYLIYQDGKLTCRGGELPDAYRRQVSWGQLYRLVMEVD